MRDAHNPESIRKVLSEMIEDLTVVADGRPKHGAEIMLAVRHLQDARMRLGVAMTVKKGENPWAN